MNRIGMEAESMVELRDLDVGYGIKKVLSGITADIGRGKFVAVLGPNGAGKTTLLRTLSRHLKRLGGSVFFNQRNMESYSQKEFAAFLAVVLTSRPDTEMFTGFEFTAMGRHPHTGLMGVLTPRDREKVWESLMLVHATDLADRPMNQLSDGERQKLFVARALAQEPQIILLDEPTSHLDLKNKMEVMDILLASCRKKEITIVASLHDVGLAARVSDQVALVKDGAVVAWGYPEEVLHGENVARVYDIAKSAYDRTMATIEMRGSNTGLKKVFCVSGAATGAVLYRALIRNGLAVGTGVLHENDVDCHIAKAVGMDVITTPAFEKVAEAAISQCKAHIAAADWIIDTGFPIGEMNRGNLLLLEYGLGTGKPILSLRAPEDLAALGLNGGSVEALPGEHAVLERLLRKGTG